MHEGAAKGAPKFRPDRNFAATLRPPGGGLATGCRRPPWLTAGAGTVPGRLVPVTFGTDRRGRLAYPVLLLLGVVDAAGYSVIGPILPAVQRATGASVLTVSLLAGCFPLAMLGGFVVAGRLAHAGRTRTALAGGLGCLIAGSVVFAVTVDLPALFAARTVMGVGSGGLWMAITFRTLEYRPGQEYLSMSRVYAAYSVGALVGPGLATLRGVHAPFVAYAVLLVACLPPALALPAPASGRTLRRDPAMLRSRRFWVAAMAIMFAILAPGILDGVLPLHLASHLSQTQIGLAYTATAILIALASALAGNARPARALMVGSAGIVTGVCLAGATAHVPTWLVALTLIGLGAGAAQTGATGILLDTVPTERIITAMVVWSQMGIAGYLVAPVLGGPLAAGLGFRWLGLLPLTAALLLGGLAVYARRPRGFEADPAV
jgi:MFS family permease